MGKWLYRFWQCSWGFLQSLAGLGVFLAFAGCPHEDFHGAVRTRWPGRGGLSLGLFIFTPADGGQGEALVWHEYGHTFQSALLGPLYLPVIGIPSMVWYRCFADWRKRHRAPYSAFAVERWADRLGDAARRRCERKVPRNQTCQKAGGQEKKLS